MEFGWSESGAAPRLRSRLPNLNLLPVELLPAPLPWLTAGLGLFALGLVMLLYALFYMKSYTDLELQALRERLSAAQQVARELGLPVDGAGPALTPGTLEDWAELRARQVDWAAVFGAVAAGPGPGVQVAGVSQAGYAVSVAGEAATAADANAFLQKLRDSGLFASLEMAVTGLEAPPAAQPVAQPTAAPPAGPPTAPPTAAPAKPQPTAAPPAPPAQVAAPPTAVPQPAAPPTAVKPQPPPAQPPAAQPPPQPTPTLAPRTPLATPSPVGSVAPVTPAAAVTPPPQTDWIVQAKRETVDPSRLSNSSHIRVRAVDPGGNLLPGLRVRVESDGQPPWTDEFPHAGHPASDGRFDLGVGMGKFTVLMLNGSSERAAGLFTGVAGQPGVHEWDVTFTKVTAGAAPSEPTCPGCTATPTPTATLTVAPTATPVSPGANLAAQACATSSHWLGGLEAPRAVDGNVDTAWESGRGPLVQITLDFTRYPNGHPRACQPKPDGEPRAVQLEAMELVARADAQSKQTHEVWTVYDSGVAQLEYTFADVDAADRTALVARFAATRTIQQLRIRTTRSGTNVGWREVRLFEPLPPAFPNVSTPVPTVFVTATPTPTAPAGALGFVSATASSENPGNPAVSAIDGNATTFWRPVANQGPQYLQADFGPPQTVRTVRFSVAMGEAVATATATVGPNTPTSTPVGSTFRVSLLRPAVDAQGRTVQQEVDRRALDDNCFTTFQQSDHATVQVNCTQAYTGVTAVRVYLDSIGNPAVPPGVRELSAYPPGGTSTPSPSATPNATPSPTATGTPTPQEAATGSINVLASEEDAANTRDKANDGTGSVQNPGTFWRNHPTQAPFNDAAWWEIRFTNGINVDRVEVSLYAQPAGGNANVTLELRNANATPIATRPLATGAYADAVTSSQSFTPRVPGVSAVRVAFGNATTVVGIRSIYVYQTPTQGGLASFLSPLDRLLSLLTLRPAYAAPLDQAPPPAQVNPGLPTPTPLTPPKPPGAQVRPFPATATPVVIGAPQIPNTTLPAVPGPASVPAAALAQPGGVQPQQAAVPAQQAPAGRVAFTIVGQVRPGGS